MRVLLALAATLLLSLSLAGAVAINGSTFSTHDYISGGQDSVSYEVTPAADRIITVAVSGSNGYAPKLSVYENEEEVPLETVTAKRGRTAKTTFTSPGEEDDPITYRFVIDLRDGLVDADYTFSYDEAKQDDAGSGTDAPELFDKALPLMNGTYKGFLGGSDSVDLYELHVMGEETITFTLKAEQKGSLGIALVDAGLVKKIDVRKFLDPETNDSSLIATFSSPREQDVSINVNGNVPYTLSIATDREPEQEEVKTPLPPLPPQPPAINDSEPTPEAQEGSSTLLLLVIVVLLAGLGVIGYFSWRKKGAAKAPKKKAKK